MRILVLWTLMACPPAYADDILIITGANTPFSNATSKRLENIFLRKTLLNEDGISWIPLNLNPDNPIRQAFSDTLFHRRLDALESYWNEQYFQGITPPYVVASVEAMLRFVTGTRGAIGYILPCHLDERVQVVFKLPTPYTLKPYCKKLAP
ncbi:MAG: hypothetical protein WAW36_07905 [Methylovulum miyakonense]|uniref:hypothetical protein n=1 Tax=Methylovulum miyakonense TaxID=645578 RepID=UPI003BB5AC91